MNENDLHFKRIEEAKKRSNYRPMVYVCSPYAGDIENNTARARRYCRFAKEKKTIPFAPHLLFPQFLSEEKERDLAIFMGLVILGKCEELWVFGGHVSPGMAIEIEKAQRWNKPIRYFTADLAEVEAYD